MSQNASPDDISSHVAVIGMSLRFPGANTFDEFWQNLASSRECVDFFSMEEAISDGADPELASSSSYVRAAGIVKDIDKFDADYFGFTKREAEAMDPQHRLFLECAVEALDSAGIDPTRFPGAIGVYGGKTDNKYHADHVRNNPEYATSLGELKVLSGNSNAFLASMVSYKLNLTGPSVSVQTGCSTGLTAVHLACQSLLAGECDAALAGAVSLSSAPKRGYMYQPGGILSADGHTRAFDAGATGTVPGNGLGIIVFCRLEDALRSRHHIHAVVRGSALNNDGLQKTGFTAPSPEGQAAVITEALLASDTEAMSIGYIEAHGTATNIGDPIEFEALTSVFGNCNEPPIIGSVKTNIGHLDAAAGIAGLIKAILILKHQKIPPSLNFVTPNPLFRTGNSLTINQELLEFPLRGTPPRVGVSAFSIGGANGHVILEQFNAHHENDIQNNESQLILTTAKSKRSLECFQHCLADYLRDNTFINLHDLAYTLQIGRTHWPVRQAFVANGISSTIERLELGKHNPSDSDIVEVACLPRIAFCFSHITKEQLYAAKKLADEDFGFGRILTAKNNLLQKMAGIYSAEDVPPTLMADVYEKTEWSADDRPAAIAYIALQISLFDYWNKLGISPAAYLVADMPSRVLAAYFADKISLSEALDYLMCEASHAEISSHISTIIDGDAHLPIIRIDSIGGSSNYTNISETAIEKLNMPLILNFGDLDFPDMPGTKVYHPIAEGFEPDATSSKIRDHNLHVIGQLWLHGAQVNWQGLFDETSSPPHRIPLPGYQFQRDTFWLSAPSDHIETGPSPTEVPDFERIKLARKIGDRSDWFSVPFWKVTPGGAKLLEDISPEKTYDGRWLIFADGHGLADLVCERLVDREQKQMVVVKQGRSLKKMDTNHYAVSWKDTKQHRRFFEALKADHFIPTNILDFTGITKFGKNGIRTNEMFLPAFNLAQELIRCFEIYNGPANSGAFAHSIHISLFTNNGVDITGIEKSTPEKRVIVGPGRTLPQDYKLITSQYIDIDVPWTDGSEKDELINSIEEEIFSVSYDQVVALRGSKRWIQGYEPIRIDTNSRSRMRIRKDGHYIIIATNVRAASNLIRALSLKQGIRLSLIGPNSLEETASRLEAELVDRKIRVNFKSALLDNEADLRRAKDKVTLEAGSVDGIFYCGLMFEGLDGPFHQIDKTAFLTTLQECENYICTFETVFRDAEIPFCIFFSSIVSALGGIGAAGICAAYNYLDQLVLAGARQRALPWSVVNGEGWFDEDFIFDGYTAAGRLESDNPGLMTLEDICEVLDRVVAFPMGSQVLASPMSVPDRQEWIRRNVLKHNRVRADESVRPQQSVPGKTVLRDVSRTTADVLGELILSLTGEAVDSEDTILEEVGWDSVTVLQAVPLIRSRLKVDVPIRSLTEVRTLADLVHLVDDSTQSNRIK